MNYQKFIVFVVSLLTIVALGVTLYYFMKDEEFINLKTTEVSVNVGDTFTLEYDHTNALDSTKIEWTIKNTELVAFNAETKQFTALKGGQTEILLETNRSGWKAQSCVVYIGDGSNANPFMIANPDQLSEGLDKLSEGAGVNSSFKLIADIDMKDKAFKPQFNGLKFNGDFDGNNHTIKNITINSAETLESAGLFYGIGNQGKVHDLTLESVVISGNIANVGAVAGFNNGVIEKVRVLNSNLSSVLESRVPQIGAFCARASAVIEGTITQPNYLYYGRIDRCEAIGVVLDGFKNSVIGGLVATLDGGNILNSFVKGMIRTQNDQTIAGGIVANLVANENANAKLKNNYAVLKFENVTKKAGIVYENDYSRYVNGSSEVISENLLWGQYFDSTVAPEVSAIAINGYANAETFNKRIQDKILVAEGVESSALKTSNIFSHRKYAGNAAQQDFDYDFTITWAQKSDVNDGYPTLQMKGRTEDGYINVNGEVEVTPQEPITPSDPEQPSDPENPEDPDDPNEPSDPNDPNEPSEPVDTRTLQEILAQSKQGEIIALSSDIDWGGNIWIPVGTENNPFNATFDGKGFTVKNIIIEIGNLTSTGLFGVIGESGVVKNVKFENVVVTGGQNVGIVTGINKGIIDNVEVINSDNGYKGIEITANTNLNAGAIAGVNQDTIKNVKANIAITVSATNSSQFRIGGIAGSNEGAIDNAESKCNINSQANTNRVGGIAGYNTKTINYVTYQGNITANMSQSSNYAGGLVGYATSSSKITLSSSNAQIKAYNVGGLVGYNEGTLDQNNAYGKFTGERLGGMIAYMNTGTMTNCSAVVELCGNSGNAVKGGFVYSIPNTSARIETCFVSATFTGQGTNYAETSTTIRQPQTDAGKSGGYIKNCIYDNDVDGDAIKQGGTRVSSDYSSIGGWWDSLWDSDKEHNNDGTFFGTRYDNVDGRTSTNDCKNSASPFKNDNRNFDNVNIWTLGNGDYPKVHTAKQL